MKYLILLIILSCSSVVEGREYYHDCDDASKQNSLYSLSCNLYWEARGESTAGHLAVGYVTMNRVKSSRFPNDVVGVVYQRSAFSWTKDNRTDKVYDLSSWMWCMQLSTLILQADGGYYRYTDITNGSLFYHTNKVNPYWADKKYLEVTIDNHLFYSNDKKK